MRGLRDRLELALGRRLVRLPTPWLRSLVRAPAVGGLDPHVHAVLVLFDRLPRPKLHELSPAAARLEMARLPLVLDGPPCEVGAVDEARVGPLPIRIYRPHGRGPWPVLVYLHGGGGVVGSLQTHDVPCPLRPCRLRGRFGGLSPRPGAPVSSRGRRCPRRLSLGPILS